MKHLKLTAEQRAALKEQQMKGPVYLVDVNSNDQYVLLRAEDYERFRALFETEDFDITETYTAQSQTLRDVWDDPALDAYNQPGE